MTVNELNDKRLQVWNAAKSFLNTHTKDGKTSAEDMATYKKMEQEVMDLSQQIDTQVRQEAIDTQLAKPIGSPIVTNPVKVESKEEKSGRASDAYRQNFINMMRGVPLSNTALATTPGAQGGYLIPAEFERQIISDLANENVMRKICKVITTEHDRKIPVADSHSTAAWTAEAASISESDPTYAQKELDAYKLADLVKISDELLQDSAFDLEAYISAEFARAFGAKEEEAFCVGDGSSKPTGLFTANGGSVGVTTAAATAITADELISLVYSLRGPYRKKAVFLMNDATVAYIRKLKDSNGVYLWQPAVVGGEPDKLLGYDLYTSAYVPTMAASAFTIAFGDFSSYWIADRKNRTMQRLNELYASNDQVGFKCTQRVDGKIILTEGIKLMKQKAA